MNDKISGADAADLSWYFTKGVDMLDTPSNMQRQLEKVAFFAIKARPCLDCGGCLGDQDGEIEKPGSGFVTSGADHKMRAMLALVTDKPLHVPGDLTCPTCNGWGWNMNSRTRPQEAVTARPTGSSKKGSGVPDTGGNEGMARLGRMSRRLSRVRDIDPRTYFALAFYYAPSGGSPAVLWFLTPAGKTMLRRNKQRLPERQFFENERERQRSNPNENRGKLFEAAEAQAMDVFRRMVEVWRLSGFERGAA